MKSVLSIIATVVTTSLALPASAVDSSPSPMIPPGALSYCVPILDFPEVPDCVGEYSVPLQVNGRVYEPVPFAASSSKFYRDEVTSAYRFDSVEIIITDGKFVATEW